MWDQLFVIANWAAAPGWAILILIAFAGDRAPPWLIEIPRLALPLGFATLYAAVALPTLPGALAEADGAAGFESLDALAALLSEPPALLAGWLHYLAFDLFVGAWATERMVRARVHPLIQTPIILSCLMLGPVGFLIAVAACFIAERRRAA